MIDLFKEIIQTLSNNKLRTSLTGVAVAWGIFMLIVLLGVSRGVYNSFAYNAMSNGARIDLYGGHTSIPYKGLKENRFIRLRSTDMDVIEREHRHYIKDVEAEININGTVSTPKDYISDNIKGIFPGYSRNMDLNILHGRFINDRDISERRKVIVLNKENAELLFDKIEEAIGKQVQFNDLAFTVVGVYERQGFNMCGIPFSTALQQKGGDNKVSSISIVLQNISSAEEANELERNIKRTLGLRHTFSPDDPSAIWIWNQYTQQMTMLSGLKILDIAIWIIGILTMLSGIVGVSNIMFVSVRERTHEIGIRRAIGAKPRNILAQILMESISITALFGYIGIFLGICATQFLSMIFANSNEIMRDPTVDMGIAMSVTVVLIVSGCLAGIFPALKALKVKPVEALRTE